MGCGTSKIENEEVVALCSTRKKHVKEAVSARHNFAAAFSGYVIALRTVGSAFSQFGEAEFRDPVTPSTSTSAPTSAFPTPVIKPQPPPLPHFFDSGVTSSQQTPSTAPPVMDPLKRSVSLPPLNLERKTASKGPTLEKIPSTEGSSPSPVKVPKNANKKKVKVPLSPSPEPEEVPKEEVDKEKTLHEDVKSNSNVENNVKASSEEKEEWVAPKPPPPPSGKPPPPPPSPPRRPSWLPDFFDIPKYPEPSQHHDDEEEFESGEKKRREQEEEEAAKRRRKLEEEREAEERKAEEERKQKQQEEMKKKEEQMNAVINEVDEDEESDDSADIGDDGDDGDEVDDGEAGDDEDEGEEGGERVEDGEEEVKQTTQVNVETPEPPKKTVNLDLPKTDLVIVTSNSNSKPLVTVLKDIDKLFQEAYESGRYVASMLEAHRVSFHPNFIDGRSSETHAKKVLRAISWSTTSVQARADPPQAADDDEIGTTHASTLDRLLAWEKKLFDEVKRAETIRVDLEKKNAWILKEESRGGNSEAVEKAKTSVKSLHTRFMVAIQGVDTARNEVLRLRDSELYPQLLELLKGIHEMWKKTHDCHRRQYEQVLQMKRLDVSDVVESSSHLHKVATEQLKLALGRWYQFFGSVVHTQREYMRHLNLYVKVSVKSVDLEKERISPASPRLPISTLCHEWQQALDRLPDKRALEAINNFVTELEVIVDLQKEETRHRKKVEQLEIDVKNKKIYVDKYEKKHLRSMSVPASEENGEVTVEVLRNPLTEKRAQLEVLMTRLEEEREKVAHLEQKSKTQTINSLQMGLQHIFNTVTSFSKQCYDVHDSLQQFANLTLLTDK